MPAEPGPTAHRWTVLYDADCGFCRASLGLVLQADRERALRPVALQSAEAEALLADLSAEQRMASWHLIAPDGARRSAGDALPALVALLPGGRRPARALARTPELNRRAYAWVAAHRGWWGRVVSAGAKRRADARIAERHRPGR